MVGQNVPYLYLRRVKIPVSPGLRSVLVWVLQSGCFLASYLNAPQMEMVRVVAWEPTAKSRVEQNVRSVLPSGQEEHQASYGRSTNFILPRAASHSENAECNGAGIQDSDFPVQAGPQASSVTQSVLRGTWGSLWETLAPCPS